MLLAAATTMMLMMTILTFVLSGVIGNGMVGNLQTLLIVVRCVGQITMILATRMPSTYRDPKLRSFCCEPRWNLKASGVILRCMKMTPTWPEGIFFTVAHAGAAHFLVLKTNKIHQIKLPNMHRITHCNMMPGQGQQPLVNAAGA